jgi:flagellar biogenesis protein FliO
MRRGRRNARRERGIGRACACLCVLMLCGMMTVAQAEPLANGSGVIAGPPAAKISVPSVAEVAAESKIDDKNSTDATKAGQEHGGEMGRSRREVGAAIEAKIPLGKPRDQTPRLGGMNTSADAGARESAGGARVMNVRGGWLMGTFVPLVVVVGLIAACAWGFRQIAKRGGGLAGAMGAGGRSPSGILFVLGRYPISRGMTLVLLQIDRRVLVVTQTARPTGMSTLCEITEPSEVASILSKARDGQGESITAKFQGLVRAAEKQLENEPYEGASLPVREGVQARAVRRKPVEVEAVDHDGDMSVGADGVGAVGVRGAGEVAGGTGMAKSGAMRELLAAMRADGARSGGGR